MTIIAGRQSAHPEQDFCLFLIGMRFNNFLAVRGWLPVMRAMPAQRTYWSGRTPDRAENIYTNMPPFGLGAAIGVTPAKARMGGLRDPFARR